MADLRGIPPFALQAELVTAETGFTVGQTYQIVALLVDSAPAPPVGYFVAASDDGGLRWVSVSKWRVPLPLSGWTA